MGKLININDEIYQKLTELKNSDKDSFSKVIRSLLEKDSILNEINESFTKLKLMIPNLQESLEYMRAVTIRFYKLPDNDQKVKAIQLNNISTKYLDEIMEVIKNE